MIRMFLICPVCEDAWWSIWVRRTNTSMVPCKICGECDYCCHCQSDDEDDDDEDDDDEDDDDDDDFFNSSPASYLTQEANNEPKATIQFNTKPCPSD